METVEQKYKQYEMLRVEILQSINIMHNFLPITYAAVGALLSYIMINLDSPNKYFEPPLLFVPIFIFMVTIFARLRLLFESIMAISAYMEVFLEPDLKEIKPTVIK